MENTNGKAQGGHIWEIFKFDIIFYIIFYVIQLYLYDNNNYYFLFNYFQYRIKYVNRFGIYYLADAIDGIRSFEFWNI